LGEKQLLTKKTIKLPPFLSKAENK